MRRRARVDENQAAIVAALRAVGCRVAITSMVGDGFADIVVQVPPGLTPPDGKRLRLFELKRPDGPRGGRKGRTLTPAQERFHARWDCDVVRDVDEALRLVGAK